MNFWPSVIGALVGAAGCTLGACALMPVSGPQGWDITAGLSDPESVPYALVRLNRRAVDILESNAPRIAGAFSDRRGPEPTRFGVGDIVSVTIFESGAGGLFIPAEAGSRSGNFVTLPNQAVDSMGNISVPYADVIRAEGRTPVEVQRSIVDALKNQALQPQVVVSLVEQRAASLTVLGDVRSPGRFPVLPSGERLLDVIGRAGGLAGQGNESWVVLERGGRRAMAPFGALIDQATNNIYMRAHDTVYVYREPQTFLALGASGRQGQIAFDAWRVSLSEAVAKASGLNDGAADPASVFLYRGETRHVAELLGVDTSKFDGPIIPIIYNINLRDPAAYFLSSRFEIHNKDVIYVSNAASVETSKFLNYIRVIVNTINDPIVAANGAYALKAAINGTSSGATIVSVPSAPTTSH